MPPGTTFSVGAANSGDTIRHNKAADAKSFAVISVLQSRGETMVLATSRKLGAIMGLVFVDVNYFYIHSVGLRYFPEGRIDITFVEPIFTL